MQPENLREFRAIDTDLRNLDPLAVIEYGLAPEQTALNKEDIERIDQILETDNTLSYVEKQDLYELGVNLRLDWLYAEDGGKSLDFPRFEAEAKSAAEFFNSAIQHAQERGDIDPKGVWGVRTKQFDLEAFRAHRYLQESETTFKGTPQAVKAREAANLKMEKVLRSSAAMMQEMEAVAHGEGKLAKRTRGLLYEHMITTYARYQTFDAENFDEIFVRSALSREDRPWNGDVTPKRSFDIVIESPEGARLLQAKNYDNTDEYAQPIEKVKDTAFGRTLRDMGEYVKDFNMLVANVGDEKVRKRTEEAGDRLDAVFGKQLAEASVAER